MNAPRPLGELQVGELVAGFWLFTHRRRVHLGVFDLDRSESRSTLRFARLEADGQATPLRRIENEESSIRAVDARVVGPDMRFVLELNLGVPLQLTRTALEPLLDPAEPPTTFSPARPIGPWPHLDERIHLHIGEHWNVANSLGPEQWLFNPRFSPGAPTASMIVNTADGQTLLLTDEGVPAGLLADAALPQWWDRPMVHEWPVDALATRIVALWHDDAWHIVLGHGEPATSLHYLRR